MTKTVLTGTVFEIEPREMGGDEILVGNFRYTENGIAKTVPFSAAGEQLKAVRGILVEGSHVALYGALNADYFRVIGPDLRKRTLAPAATVAAPARRPLSGKALGAVIARRRAAAQAA